MLIDSSEFRASSPAEDEVSPELTPEEILGQLERIISSSPFRNSKRYPSLLRYIVDEALAGRGDTLKERTLGISVFGRDPDYDTNADPVVRITAGEVRKRIAQYYQAPGNEHEVRIDIPLGSYQPRFYRYSAEKVHVPSERESYGDSRTGVLPDKVRVAETLPRYTLSPTEHATSSVSQPDGMNYHEDSDDEVLPAYAAFSRTSEAESPTVVVAPQAVDARVPPFRPPKLAFYVLLLTILGMLSFFGWQTYQKRQLSPGIALFWGRCLATPESTLIVLGVHSFDAQGNDISYRSHVLLPQTQQTLLSAMTRSDMVQLSDLTSFTKITTLLTQHDHSFHTQGAADTTLEQLRQGPFILVGGFNNLWTTKLTRQLPFRFVTLEGGRNVIQDNQHPERIWTLDTKQSALSNTRDYGMVSCFLDPESNEYVLIAAGIGKSGTEAAAEFLTNEAGLSSWLRSTKTIFGDNVQVLISTDVVEGKIGSPHVIDYARW